MKLVLRAVVPATRAADGGDELVAVRAGDIAALASRADAAPSTDAAALRAHHDIAARIHDGGPSLPSRFGQAFDDEAALAGALHERGTALAEALVSVGDQVEMSVTLMWKARPSPAARPEPLTGRAFMESRAARERERRVAEEAVDRLIDVLAVERAFTRNRICPRDGVAAIVAVLVERGDVRGFGERVSAFARDEHAVIVTVHGPMPPYTFTS